MAVVPIAPAPPRPVDDAIIDTPWGTWVHDCIVGLASRPACAVYDLGQTAAGAGADVVLLAPLELYDNDAMHSSSPSSRITIKTAGLYVVSAVCQFDAHATGRRQLKIRTDGGTAVIVQSAEPIPTSPITLSGQLVLKLNQNQYVEPVVNQNSGTTLNVLLTQFAAVLVAGP